MERSDSQQNQSELLLLREEVDLKLIERERRLFANIFDLYEAIVYDGWRGKRFLAALKAVLFTLFSPSTVATAGIGLATLVTLFLAWQSNQLLTRQNDLLNVQNLLQESSRRAGLTVELTEVLNRISDTELPSVSSSVAITSRECKQETYGYSFRVPPTNGRVMRGLPDLLLGRVVALSNSFRPYRYLDIDRNDLSSDSSSGLSNPMSPERAQLLFALANAHIDMSQIADAGGQFARVPLGNSQLTGMQINNISLSSSDFNGAILVYTNFLKADLSYSNFVEANATCSNFAGANLVDVDMADGQFMGAVFDDAVMQGVNLDIAKFQDASFQRADLRGAYVCVEGKAVILDTKEAFVAKIGEVKIEGAIFGAETTLGSNSQREQNCSR